MNKNIIWILAGAAAIYILAKRSLSKKLQFDFSSVGTSGTVTSPKIVVHMAALNPSNQSATINSIVGELYVNNKFLGNVTSFNAQKILPKASSDVSFTIKPSLLSALPIIKSIISNKTKGYSFTFKGNANVDGIVVPVETSYSL
jgi:hypothetical protein